jgi:hypothetical protein
MKIRLSVLALSTAMLAACGGDPPQPETPPPPAPAAPEPTPAAEPAPADPGAAAGAEAPKKVDAAPAKPNKEKIAARWSFDFSGEAKTLAEEDAKKKSKDEKKQAEALTKAETAFTKKAVEFAGDTVTVYDGDKAIKKVKYEVVKDEGSTLTIKFVGKDEISKKDMATAPEMTISFKDDTTIEMKDPVEKDQAKAKMIVLKRK